MAYSGGLTRRITILLARAAELAILQKTESVVLNLLMDVAATGIFKITAEQEIDHALV